MNNDQINRIRWRKAFTLIELLVVLAIIAVLAMISMPKYFSSLEKGKNAVLETNLHTVRETIDKFYSDQGRYPLGLQELVERKYLRSIPSDPITESSSTWVIILDKDGENPGVANLKSGASGATKAGVPYASF
jgi:general secretion pathway protein G